MDGRFYDEGPSRGTHGKTVTVGSAARALIVVPANDAHLDSKASVLDSSRLVPRLAGTMIKAAARTNALRSSAPNG